MPTLDVKTAIRLRWLLRDIKAQGTRFNPISAEDIKWLVELGLIEMRENVVVITVNGDRSVGFS